MMLQEYPQLRREMEKRAHRKAYRVHLEAKRLALTAKRAVGDGDTG